ncbi:IS5 family transposase [Limisphaera sp. 4302-co]|uniref:IS5 family transposase n=1 Tax=Limisphaera sp. 4302-co TaxID=3400417 RepID=UPI003C2749E6
MLKVTGRLLKWFYARIPDPPKNCKGCRPRTGKRKALAGSFWLLANGAKWKDLPRQFGTKSAVHRFFQRLVREGVFERLLQEAGQLVEERGEYRLYECFPDAAFCPARGGGDGIGRTKVGKGVKILIAVDARGLPIAVQSCSARPHESTLAQGWFDLMLTKEVPERVVGDKAWESDALDRAFAARGMELMAPHRSSRRPENRTQDGRSLRRYRRRWVVERTLARLLHFRRLCVRWEKSSRAFEAYLQMACAFLLVRQVLV